MVKNKTEEFVKDKDGKNVLDKEGNKIPKKVVTAEPVVEPKKTVEVDADVLEKLVTGFESMKQKVTDLEGAADIGRLGRIQAARNDGKLVKHAKVNFFNNKYVVGWVTVKDDVFFDESGKMYEDQQIKLFLHESGEKKASETEPMSYRAFARLTTKVEGEVVKESKDADGVVSFTVLLPEGLELELPIVFLN